MEILNTRRMTGPSLFTELAGAILEVDVPNSRQDEAVQVWETNVRRYLNAIGWENAATLHRKYENGISLYFTAPIDALYAACEVNEAAWHLTVSDMNGTPSGSFGDDVARLKIEITSELNPSILALKEAAQTNSVRFLQSDEMVSVGTGKGSQTFDVDKIPDPSELDWEKIHDVPVILITGTNGKSTTVRLLEIILSEAGLTPGASSTDGIRVNKETIEAGDYSGPEGARTTLRNEDISSAVLEVARGGILRRGMPVEDVQAAIVTNVAEDHFGEWGVNSLPEMVETKFVVRKVLKDGGQLVLNADDQGCVDFGKEVSETICWFSLDSQNPVISNHLKSGGRFAYLDGNQIKYANGTEEEIIGHVSDFPITMNGLSRHNILNCLGAILLAKSLEIKNSDIFNALSNFGTSYQENPARGNIFKKDGSTIVVDFAHNPHGLSAIIDMVSQMEGKRKLILLGQAGDRSNDDIRGLVDVAVRLNPQQVMVCEIPKYIRGREEGEIPDLIKSYFMDQGIQESSIIIEKSIYNGVLSALDWMESGDLLLLLTLDQKEKSIKAIQAFCEA